MLNNNKVYKGSLLNGYYDKSSKYTGGLIMKRKIKQWDDGDSGVFSDGTRFRLNNVRTPEKYQFGGEKATRTAAGMTARANGQVSWNSIARDKYGRQIGNMSNKDGSINQRMRDKGYRSKGR